MKSTPKAAEKAAKKFVEKTIEITLPSGKKFCKIDFKGKHVRESQRLMNGDESLYMFAVISVTGLIDGKRITVEELDDFDGVDILAMMAEYNSLF